MPSSADLTDIKALESEAIYILREAVAQFRLPVLLFSGGKDSIVLTRLAEKAFYPSTIPFQLMLIDTGHNFPETISFIQQRLLELKVPLLIASVQKTIDLGQVMEETGPSASRNRLQSVTLMESIREHQFDCVIGGARRDEEKARAKERIFSRRDDFGRWEPKNQRPELWNLFNGRIQKNEHMRVFPLSNWTELDIWAYIAAEKLSVPSIYFSHSRSCIERNDKLIPYSQFLGLLPGEKVKNFENVRVRTVGDMTCTTVFRSTAKSVAEIIEELNLSNLSERGGRLDDSTSDSSMEDRKNEGYF
jgi:sulfate adenylyltransferase subunit 2